MNVQDDDDLDETEDPDESDQDAAEDESETLPCPRCGEEVYDDSDRCPHCGEYITTDTGSSSRSTWMIVAAVLALLGVLLWMVF